MHSLSLYCPAGGGYPLMKLFNTKKMPLNILTTSEAAERLQISRQAFHRSLLPLLAQRGEARQFGRQWAIDGKDFWMWEVYAATRKNLIAEGKVNESPTEKAPCRSGRH